MGSSKVEARSKFVLVNENIDPDLSNEIISPRFERAIDVFCVGNLPVVKTK